MRHADIVVENLATGKTSREFKNLGYLDYDDLRKQLRQYCEEDEVVYKGLLTAADNRVLGDSSLPVGEHLQLTLQVASQAQGPSVAPGSPRLAADSVQGFWKYLPCATLEGNLLKLSGGTYFLGEESKGDALLVRNCYGELLGLLQQHFNEGGRRFVITGNPGIGKTVLGHYLLYLLSRRRVTVVWQSHMLQACYLLRPDSPVEKGDLKDFDRVLYDSTTWYLVDGMEPADRAAKTVLVSSPHRKTYKEFLKLPRTTKRYMPVWSEAELVTCRSALFPEVSEETVIELYDKWGGIPRYVLEKAKEPAAQDGLEEAIAGCNAAVIHNSIGQIEAADDASHRILHIDVQPDYLTRTVKFASQWVADRLVSRLYDQQLAGLRTLLEASAATPELGVFRGQLWEGFAHKVLAAGGVRRVRDLDTDAEDTIVLPQAKIIRFKSLDEVSNQGPGVYCQPVSKRFAAVDALEQNNMLFQITINEDHEIKGSELRKVLNCMKSPSAECCLYFVVPPDKFPFMAKQKITRPGEGTMPNFRQLVLEVPTAVGC